MRLRGEKDEKRKMRKYYKMKIINYENVKIWENYNSKIMKTSSYSPKIGVFTYDFRVFSYIFWCFFENVGGCLVYENMIKWDCDEIMKICETRKCEVVVLMMWLSFWHSQRTLGLTAFSLTISDGAPHFM
jgi:hypothetical protein